MACFFFEFLTKESRMVFKFFPNFLAHSLFEFPWMRQQLVPFARICAVTYITYTKLILLQTQVEDRHTHWIFILHLSTGLQLLPHSVGLFIVWRVWIRGYFRSQFPFKGLYFSRSHYPFFKHLHNIFLVLLCDEEKIQPSGMN